MLLSDVAVGRTVAANESPSARPRRERFAWKGVAPLKIKNKSIKLGANILESHYYPLKARETYLSTESQLRV